LNLTPNLTLIIQMVIFLVLMVALDKILFKPMMRVINERKARTVGRREAAANASTKADTIWEDYQKGLASARSQADASRMEIIREAEGRRQEITDAALKEAEATVAKLRADIRSEAEKASDKVKAEVDSMAKAMAEKIMGRAI